MIGFSSGRHTTQVVALALAIVAAGCSDIRELELRFRSGDLELAGTVLLPHEPGPHPGVVLVHGASPRFSTREPYRIFAEHFARHGTASLIFDKRSFGASEGTLPFVFEDLARDIEAAFRELQAQPEIDAARVGLWGISEGGWTAPLAASRLPDAAFLVLVSGGGVPPHRTVQHEIEARLREAGFAGSASERALALQRRVDDLFRGAADEATWQELLAARAEPWFEHAFGIHPEQVPASPDGLEIDRADYRRVLDFSALPLLRELAIPMLFVFGAEDPSVPVAESVRALRATLEASDARFEIEVFPDADHLIRTPGGRFAPGFLERMTGWMQQQVRGDVSGERRVPRDLGRARIRSPLRCRSERGVDRCTGGTEPG